MKAETLGQKEIAESRNEELRIPGGLSLVASAYYKGELAIESRLIAGSPVLF